MTTHREIADQLKAQITTGTLKAGQAMPSGRDLARMYGVSPAVAQRALAALEEAELVDGYGQGRRRTVRSEDSFATAQERVIASLRVEIEALPAGTPVGTMATLATRFGVSASVIRDALRALNSEVREM